MKLDAELRREAQLHKQELIEVFTKAEQVFNAGGDADERFNNYTLVGLCYAVARICGASDAYFAAAHLIKAAKPKKVVGRLVSYGRNNDWYYPTFNDPDFKPCYDKKRAQIARRIVNYLQKL